MFLVLDDVNMVSKLLRRILSDVDWLIYKIISWILEGIFNLSELMASPALVKIIYRRIYVILAIFMVFKLTVSFIQYLVNPDKMTDKETGVGKVISRTVIMLAMLIVLPIIFFEPMPGRTDGKTIPNVLQTGVMKTLPKIILGISSDSDSGTDEVSSKASENGQYLAVKMLESFYYPARCNSDSPAYDGKECTTSDTELKNINEFWETVKDKADKGGVFKYQYMWPLTTIAGILLVVILLGFAIDVSIRAFKLLLLQMIAPVPVMSYIDPKSSKDGAFASWLKALSSTFVEIFLKLAVIYLLLFLISKLFASGDQNLFGDSIDNISGWMARNFVRVFLVIGLFKFAKDAPKFIKDALGIKDKGGGGGFMGKMMSGVAGAAAGFAGGVAAGGLAGGLSGAAQGASGSYNAAGTGKPFNAFANARDDIAKMRTGNQNARGGVMGKLQTRAVKAEGRHLAKSEYGLNKSNLDAMEQRMHTKNAKAAEAKKAAGFYNSSVAAGTNPLNNAAMRGFLHSHVYANGRHATGNDRNDLDAYINESGVGLSGMGGTFFDSEGNQYNDSAALEYIADSLSTDAEKYSKAFEKTSKRAEEMYVKEGFHDKYSHKARRKNGGVGRFGKTDEKAHGKGGFDDRSKW